MAESISRRQSHYLVDQKGSRSEGARYLEVTDEGADNSHLVW